MTVRPRLLADRLPRALAARVLTGFLLAFAAVLPAQATLLPEGFFDVPVAMSPGSAAVEADVLSYNASTSVISAEGGVVLSYGGMIIRADKLEFNQTTGQLMAIGNVTITDRAGSLFEMDQIEITDGMKEAFLDSLTVTTAAGAVVTARNAHFQESLVTVLTEATYSPCGLCIDSKGRKVGWKVRAARMIYDRESASVIVEQPSIELLGIPVAWLPWYWIPDPTQPRARGLRSPKFDSSETRGVQAAVPFFVPVGEDIDIILTPTLMSRQGFLARGDLTWRLPELQGTIEVKASGLYQLDPAVFATAKIPAQQWRGAIQTSGHFTPIEHWSAGWSYSAFTDNAYLTDYELTDAKSSVNQVYATHLSDSTWFDARIQRFNRLGNYAASDDKMQGMALPKVEFEQTHELPDGWGQLHLDAKLLGVRRELDQTGTYGAGAVPYVFGYEGYKAHGMVEGSWQNQYVLPGGIAATPYLGARLDATFYNRTAAPLPAPYATPTDTVLFNATPIAALDVRWPIMATTVGSTHMFEPIAQIVYRGSNVTKVGVTNDDAHSFVFDTSNLFSYNRFTGIDRQETGLRANIGGHYLANFDNGAWLDFVAGQSFHLAGLNALGVSDHMQVGTSTGLGMAASFMVGSVRGGLANISGGAKVQVDPSAWRITRFGAGVNYTPFDWLNLGADYIYIAANPALGIDDNEHEIAGTASLKIADYYTLKGGLTWNLDTMAWHKANAGLTYDDGYLNLSGSMNFTPTSWGYGFSFGLKGPDGQLAF